MVSEALKPNVQDLQKSDEITVLKSAIEQDETKVMSEIDALNADIVELDTRLDLWQPKVERILKNLKHDLDFFLMQMNEKFSSTFSRTMNQSTLKPVSQLDDYYSFKEMPFGEIRELDKGDFTNIILGNLYRSGVKELEFESKEEADNVSRLVADCLREFVEVLLNKIIEETKGLIEFSQQELNNENDCHPIEIIEKAQQRIEEKFNIILKLEPPYLKISGLDDISSFKNKAISESKPPVNVRLHNYFMRMFKIEHKIIKENRYCMHIESYIQYANYLVEEEVKRIEKDVQAFIKNNFKNQIYQYIQKLKEYLGNYQNTLEQALKEKTLSAEDNQARKRKISSLIDDTEELIKPTREFLASTKQLLCQ